MQQILHFEEQAVFSTRGEPYFCLSRFFASSFLRFVQFDSCHLVIARCVLYKISGINASFKNINVYSSGFSEFFPTCYCAKY